jgi:hypothetical protein
MKVRRPRRKRFPVKAKRALKPREGLTHDELVEVAAKYLARRHPVVITEMVSACPETPDALGWQTYGSTLIECKTSRSDFANDAKKLFREFPDTGLGDLRYYLTPPGLLKVSEIPPCWGLLETDGKMVRAMKLATRFDRDPSSYRRECQLLVSALRRQAGNVSVRPYVIDTARKASLGIELGDDCGASSGEASI